MPLKLNHVHLPDPDSEPCSIQLMLSRVSAGFQSPADDFLDKHLDLNEFLIKHPSATIFAWAHGNSLENKGISDGDLLIIDRAVNPCQGSVVVAALDGELTVKILDKKNGLLLPANPEFDPIDIKNLESLVIEGVVIHSIKKHF